MPEQTAMLEATAIQETMDYDQFEFLSNNREANRSHIEALKRAFEEYGNLTKTQPVLVNERFQIIDGQHRFVACQELGAPIYYTMVPGLGIQEARQMNILHRSWTPDDYARSYAVGGNKHYINFVNLKEDYGWSHSIILDYVNGDRKSKGMFAEFREGNMVINDLNAVKERLDMLKAVEEIVGPRLAAYKPFASAFLRVLSVDGFQFDRFLKKLIERPGDLKFFSTIEDNLRQLEEVYNFMYSDKNRTRFF